MTRLRVLVAVVALTGFVLVGCGDDGLDVEQGRLEVSGRVVVDASDGSQSVVTDGHTVDFGDVITVEDGTATLTLARGQVYELRSGEEDAVLEVASAPRLLAGDVLVSEGFPAQLRWDTTTLSARGAVKVESAVPQAVAYAGRTRIDGAGDLDELLGLRQVVLTPSAEPSPLDYDGADDWDRRYLGEAIAFGERLEALARGYTADLGPGGGRSASFFEAVLPPLDDEPEFSADLLDPDRDVGETLVGAAIAVQGVEDTFRERWVEVFSFRDDGAAWGIVALDQGVSSAPLLETIELAITTPTSSLPPSTTEPPETTTSSPSPTTTNGPPTTGGTPPPSPPTSPPPPPSTGLLEPLVDPVSEILQDLLEVLGLGAGGL